MPFALTDEEKNPTTQGQQTAAPNISGPSGTAVNVPGQTAAAGPKVSGPRKSGQYQNIQKYLAANAPQGEMIGQKVGGVVEKEVGEAQQAGQTLGGQVQKVEAYDPTKVLGNLPQATEEEKKTYQSTKQTGGYTGPSDVTGLGGYGAFQTEKGQAETTLGQAGTETGQRELVKTAYQRPTYSTGQQTLDVSLLGQSAGGKQAIQDITQRYQPLVQALGGVTEQAQTGIQSARQQAAQNVAAFSPAEQQAEAAILSPIEQRATQINKEQEAYNRYLQDLSDLNLTPETMQALGLTAGQRTWGLNLGQYVQTPTEQATVQNIATAQERQRFNDLVNFLGVNAGQLGLGEPTFQGGAVDTARLGADIGKISDEFTRTVKSIGGQTGDPIKDIETMKQSINANNNTIQANNNELNAVAEFMIGMPSREALRAYPQYADLDWFDLAIVKKQLKDNIANLNAQNNQFSSQMNQINDAMKLFNYGNVIQTQGEA